MPASAHQQVSSVQTEVMRCRLRDVFEHSEGLAAEGRRAEEAAEEDADEEEPTSSSAVRGKTRLGFGLHQGTFYSTYQPAVR